MHSCLYTMSTSFSPPLLQNPRLRWISEGFLEGEWPLLGLKMFRLHLFTIHLSSGKHLQMVMGGVHHHDIMGGVPTMTLGNPG